MRVNIGPYTNYIGPYQIADAIFFWCEKYPEDKLEERWDYRAKDWLGDWLAKDSNGKDSKFTKFCTWVNEHKKRKVKIHIDRYDVWSADHTLALIILPMLKTLKETKQGSGCIDPADVPDHLWPTVVPGPSNNYEDDTIHTRYEWFLDELIWTFEQMVDDDDESKFYDHSAVDDSASLNNQIRQIKTDWDGLHAHKDRIANGLRLFGKYFQTLWD